MAVTSTKSKRFNPFSLDAINFLLADVRGAVGPYLNVFLVTQQHWSQINACGATCFSNLAVLAGVRTRNPPRSFQDLERLQSNHGRLQCW